MGRKKKSRSANGSLPINKAERNMSVIHQPMTPFERRMAFLSKFAIDPELLSDPLEKAWVVKEMNRDISLQFRLRSLSKRIPAVYTSRMHGGSGLVMSDELRSQSLSVNSITL